MRHKTSCGVPAARCRIAVTESFPTTSVAHAPQDQNRQLRVPKTRQPARVRYLPQPVDQRRRHRQRANPTGVYREFGPPQRQIGEVANNRADQGR
jgi:hypothetical protein